MPWHRCMMRVDNDESGKWEKSKKILVSRKPAQFCNLVGAPVMRMCDRRTMKNERLLDFIDIYRPQL